MKRLMPTCIIAFNSASSALINVFDTVNEAAAWVNEKGVADCHGHKAAIQTIKNNITNCIKQPNIYKQFYGIKWVRIDKDKLQEFLREGQK